MTIYKIKLNSHTEYYRTINRLQSMGIEIISPMIAETVNNDTFNDSIVIVSEKSQDEIEVMPGVQSVEILMNYKHIISNNINDFRRNI